MTNKLHISVSPHFHSPVTTQSIMRDVIIALLPTSIAGTVIYGFRALAVIATCVGFAVLSEYVFNKLAKKDTTISDLSAVVTGLLLALTLPSDIPLWQAAIGSVFAIVFVKGVFGGIGQNFANPAITARIFMVLAFKEMASAPASKFDAISSATPLAVLESGSTEGVTLLKLFLGNRGGDIGESCTIALIIGFIYLLARKVITWHIPVAYIGSVFLLSFAITGADAELSLMYTLAGGLFIGAIFMATDYATSPFMPAGKLLFGLGAGILTALIRFYGTLPEGVSFSILFMNILTPYIDSWTKKKPFGGDVK